MKSFVIVLFSLTVVGCASDPEVDPNVSREDVVHSPTPIKPDTRRAKIAEQEVERLDKPIKPFSTFRNYDLKPLTMSQEVRRDNGKLEESNNLEAKLASRINPLIEDWRSKKQPNMTGSTLIIEPIVQKLRIIRARSLIVMGPLPKAFIGDSFIDLDLKFTDSATGQLIANPRIHRSADAWAGAWTNGKTDLRLLDYIADIAYRYLEINY